MVDTPVAAFEEWCGGGEENKAMAKKKGQGTVEAIDEPVGDLPEPQVSTVGQRLRVAREAKGLTLEDVAAQTRIPRRHLESLENSD